jgi:hypothetical protein
MEVKTMVVVEAESEIDAYELTNTRMMRDVISDMPEDALDVDLITTYGFTTKETGGGYYDRKKEKVPLTRMSAMPLPRLFLIVIVAFVPLLNTILTLVGFVYAAINGYGPTGADIGAWFKTRFKKKGE